MVLEHSGPRDGTPGTTVTTAARLHLGFIDPDGTSGRRFGSIGLAIDRPATRLTVRTAAEFGATGPEADRAIKAARRYSHAFAGGAPFHVDVAEAIPPHTGLGSGTQLALAIGAAILRNVSGRAETDPGMANRLGAMAERGARSAIGIASFTGGGFIIDAGKSPRPELAEAPPALLMQIPFPEAWRVILIVDDRVEGVHGDAETAAFAALPPFGAAAAARLSHIVLMQLAPALLEADLDTFGAALTEIQERVGGYFAPAQGGSAWSSPAVGALARRLQQAGATGIGQSSWGPTGFAVLPDQAAAESLYRSFVEEAKALGLSLAIVRGRNTGARIG
ncbi:MAG: GHMP kinase [Hyphomicrobiaceae bacterium]|nr:GHMP kinase [Hyphomicrobiaceae bacterium]